jgi:tetratricopeptide (TPR) repeat protein
MNTNEAAENLKTKGNTEFQSGNYLAALRYYTQALGIVQIIVLYFLEIHPTDALYTNRAAANIQLKDYTNALEDCKAALSLNP